MTIRHTLETDIRQWIKQNRKETRRLEFKLRVELGNPGAQSELVKDIIALANSEGESPRASAYYVIGFKDGRCLDIRDFHYDGAPFGEILDAHISPPIDISYEEFSNGRRGRIGVLVISPNPDELYVVRKRMKGHSLLTPGQCWGRKGARNVELSGEAIHKRIIEISERKIAAAEEPLFNRITHLEQNSGPSLEVKRIRFEIEASRDWNEIQKLLERLFPYAREFDDHVHCEVMSALSAADVRMRHGMPLSAFEVMDSLLEVLTPMAGGGISRPSTRKFTSEERKLFRWVGDKTFELTWDACRYLRNFRMVEMCAQRYFYLIRIATLNGLKPLATSLIAKLRDCQNVCKEERDGKPFTEAAKVLEMSVRNALDPSY